MIIARLPRRYEKVIYYEVVKCVKCGSISVRKALMYKPVYDWDFVRLTEKYFRKPKNQKTSLLETIKRIFGSKKLKNQEVKPKESYHCIDGLCQNCIDKENLSLVFSEDNPIRNYRNAYDTYTNKLPYIFYSKEKSLPSRITKEFLSDLNADAYNSVIRGSDPKTIQEKRALAEKYVESAKESIINHIMPRIQTDENYIRLKNSLDKAANEVLDFLQKSGKRIYRCSNLNYRKGVEWIKAESCPSMPDSIVSDCKFYYLAERYNAEKTLRKIKERMNTDLFAEFESYFEKFFDTLKSKIAKSHLWDIYE